MIEEQLERKVCSIICQNDGIKAREMLGVSIAEFFDDEVFL